MINSEFGGSSFCAMWSFVFFQIIFILTYLFKILFPKSTLLKSPSGLEAARSTNQSIIRSDSYGRTSTSKPPFNFASARQAAVHSYHSRCLRLLSRLSTYCPFSREYQFVFHSFQEISDSWVKFAICNLPLFKKFIFIIQDYIYQFI